jgi:hypothetical protein
MKRLKLSFPRWADTPGLKRVTKHLVLVVTSVSAIICAYMSAAMWGLRGATTGFDDWLFGSSLVITAMGLAYVGRKLSLSLMHGILSLSLRLLAFPVVYVRDQSLWFYFAITGGGMVVGLYKLASAPIVPNLYLYLALGCAAPFVAGLLYHLVRHRLAEVMAVSAVLPLLAGGIYLLVAPTPKEDSYNQVMQMKTTEEGKKDLPTQAKLLDVFLNASAQDYGRSRLSQLVLGEPSLDLAARAYFHKAVVLVQMPNKGKEAFDEVSKSLALNPGNMYSGLTADEAALWKNDSDQARRLLEKLIRSGQDGGKGRPNQPGNPGEKGPPQPDRRDPSRQPGSGRSPNNIL